MNDMVYIITGIIPYSNGERTTVAVYLNKGKAIERMNKEDFHQQIVRGVLASNEFSRLMSIGLSAIDEDDKRRICSQLTAAKVPVEYSPEEGFDENLVRLANCITARAVSVR